MIDILSLFGRFHPLLVHLPIGILVLAFLFECLAVRERYKALGKAVRPALLWGALFAIFTAISGYLLRQEGGYDEALADRHQIFGILTAVLAVAAYVLRPRVKYWVDPGRKRIARVALLVPLILCLTLAGHWGGSLTHGEDYLFAALSLDSSTPRDPSEKIRMITDVNQAVFYKDVVQPILEARCYDCHSSSRQKGDLRLDGQEFIMKGGKDGPILRQGPADSSALYKRLILPLEHDDHMPPNEKPQPSSSEIALIQYWIEGHASFDKPVSEFANDEKIAAIVKAMQVPSQESWIPKNSVSAASERVIERLRSAGIEALPLAEDSNYLMVSFTGKKSITDDQIKALEDIREQLVWLNFSHSSISDQQLPLIARLTNLRVLYLNYTSVTDEGLSQLSALKELRWLSVVGTKVSDVSTKTISQFENLSDLYLYQSAITKVGINAILSAKKELHIDTGNYMLEKLPSDTIVFRRTSK
jgi:uncharacterized membrane protein